MSSIARSRLALVVAFALVFALAVPMAGIAKMKPAKVGSAAYWAPDAYESRDDTWTTAPVLPTVSYHTLESSATDFNETMDVDWFKMTVTATGTPIFIDSRRVGGQEFDIHLYIFSSNASGVPNPTASANDDDHWYFESYASSILTFTANPGTYYGRIQSHWHTDASRDYAGEWSGGNGGYYLYVTLGNARRIYGADRYATAVEVTKNTWGDSDNDNYDEGPAEDTVFLASGASFADALAAGAISANEDVPLLLTPPTALPGSVKSEIKRLADYAYRNGTDDFTVYICGGTSAVSTAVENAVKSIEAVSKVVRLGGANRYSTAAKIADEASSTLGLFDAEVFLANGLSFADSLAAGPVAGAADAPILLTPPTGAASETVAWMTANGTTDVMVCGGTSVIPTAVLDAIQASVPGTQTFTRLAGADRYKTAYEIAQHGVANHSMEGSGAIVVSGMSFADGLAAAQISYFTDEPILLTPPTALSSRVESYYAANDGFDECCYLVGGPAAVSDTAFNAFRDMWKKPF